MVKGTWIVAAALALSGTPALAQETPAAQPPAAPAASVPAAPPASATSQVAARRAQVRMMESVLTNAVRAGAEMLARQMQLAEPGSVIITGTARARGFVLDGYGVFFDVDVPMMNQSVIWSTRVMLREQQRAQLQRWLQQLPEGPDRRRVQQMLAAIDRTGAPLALAMPIPSPPPPPPAGSGTATAQSVNETATAAAAKTLVLPPAATVDTRDPNEQYTDAVKTALIDAMLDYNFNVGADEWLTVAARDAEGPMTPNEIYDASTLVFSAKGSDLLAFRAGRLTREEARKKVIVREF
jgi:hypothetical protein